MKTLTLRSDKHPSSVTLALDDANGRAILLARADDSQAQVAYLEFKFSDLSVSLFNSSDLGLTVDNLGVTNIHILKVEGDTTAQALVLPSPNGTLFRITPDNNGNLIGVAV